MFGPNSIFNYLPDLTALHYFPLRVLTQLHFPGVDRFEEICAERPTYGFHRVHCDCSPFYRDVSRIGCL